MRSRVVIANRGMGQTGRSFVCHLKEHCKAFKNAEEIRSAVAEHAFHTGHSTDYSNEEL